MIPANFYSIIIVHYNGKDVLKDCLLSLRGQVSKNFEAIVVDNGSVDQSAAYIRENFPEVRLIESKINLGYTGGNNLGIKNAIGDWYVLLNNDIVVDPSWLKEMNDFILTKNNLGACGCKTINFYNKDTIDIIGLKMDSFGFPIAVGHLEKDNGQFDNYSRQLFIHGSCFFIKKEAALELNEVFDERYFLLSEDLDLSWRVKLAGYDLYVNTAVKIFHKSASTFKKMPKTLNTRYLSEKNIMMNLIKNYSVASLIMVIIPYIGLYFCESVFFLLTGNFRLVIGLWKAAFYNIIHLPGTLKRRAVIQKSRKFQDDSYLNEFCLCGSEKIRMFKEWSKHV